MKKGIFTLSILSLLLSQASNAEYMIKIPLEPKSIQFNDAEVAGSIELTPSTINRGESATINWDYTFANSINIEDIGQFTNKNGYVLVNPLTSRSYNVEIINGSKKRNEVLNLTVIQPNQNITFNANPTRIGFGQSTQLSWNVTGASSVAIDNGVGYNLSNTDSYNISPTTSTTYTLTAGGFEGVPDKTSSVNVEVVPNAIINTFEVDRENVTRGKSVIFSWNVANAESLALNPFGPLVQRTSGTQSIPFNTTGTFVYTLEATSLSGVKDQKSKTINVFDPAVISSFTVNGQKTVDVSPNDDLNFLWNATSAPTLTLNGTQVSGTTQTLAANAQVGSTTYTLQATNAADDSVTDSVQVNVIANPTIGTITAPTTVFASAAFTASWSGTNVTSYKIRSNNAASGIATTDVNLGTAVSRAITPTAAGSFTYTITATNSVGKTTTKTFVVSVQANPTITTFTATPASVTAGGTTTLAWTTANNGTLSINQSVGTVTGTNKAVNVGTTTGTKTYTLTNTRVLNGVTRTATRNVSVTVASAITPVTYKISSYFRGNNAWPGAYDEGDIVTFTPNTSISSITYVIVGKNGGTYISKKSNWVFEVSDGGRGEGNFSESDYKFTVNLVGGGTQEFTMRLGGGSG